MMDKAVSQTEIFFAINQIESYFAEVYGRDISSSYWDEIESASYHWLGENGIPEDSGLEKAILLALVEKYPDR